MRAGSMRCRFAASRIWEEKGEGIEGGIEAVEEEERPEEEERFSEKARTDLGAGRSASLARLSAALSGAGAGRSYSSSTMRSTTSPMRCRRTSERSR